MKKLASTSWVKYEQYIRARIKLAVGGEYVV